MSLDIEYLASNLTVDAEIVDVYGDNRRNDTQNLVINIHIAGVFIGTATIKMKDGALCDDWDDDECEYREVKHYEPHVRKVTSSGSLPS